MRGWDIMGLIMGGIHPERSPVAQGSVLRLLPPLFECVEVYQRPSPTPGPGGEVTSSANNPPAPRATLVQRVPHATLVKLPPPRAQLVSDLPPPVQGQQYLATMPYDNLEVLATFRGWLKSQDDLPSHPNQIGDMYVINGVSFVWLFAPGASRAGWIDP
jgi:hypothetical protein